MILPFGIKYVAFPKYRQLGHWEAIKGGKQIPQPRAIQINV
ncbi:MAG: hypothetical protein WHS38_03595 [Thermodesulforhabdaceae bacterium]